MSTNPLLHQLVTAVGQVARPADILNSQEATVFAPYNGAARAAPPKSCAATPARRRHRVRHRQGPHARRLTAPRTSRSSTDRAGGPFPRAARRPVGHPAGTTVSLRLASPPPRPALPVRCSDDDLANDVEPTCRACAKPSSSVANTFYLVLTFMASYLTQTLGYDTGLGLAASVVGAVAALVPIPFVGALSDRVGRRPVLVVTTGALALLAFPVFLLIGTSPAGAIAGQAVLGILMGALVSTTLVSMTEVFPARVRAAGSSFAYTIAAAAFGGTAPFAAAFLIAHREPDRPGRVPGRHRARGTAGRARVPRAGRHPRRRAGVTPSGRRSGPSRTSPSVR